MKHGFELHGFFLEPKTVYLEALLYIQIWEFAQKFDKFPINVHLHMQRKLSDWQAKTNNHHRNRKVWNKNYNFDKSDKNGKFPTNVHSHYGNTGCGVFKRGVQN